MTGTISYFNFHKMFGFIQDENGDALYFNRGGILRNADDVRVGSTVSFDVQPAPVGRPLRCATNLVVGAPDPHYFGKAMLAGTAALAEEK